MFIRYSCKITIAKKYIIRGIHSVKIVKSIHQLIQSATLEIPLSYVLRNQEQLTNVKILDSIREGDAIEIELSHNENSRIEFSGFIRRINYVDPLELICEDELYLLRKVTLKASFRKISLRDLLFFVLSKWKEQFPNSIQLFDNIPDFTFTNFIIREGTGIDVLQELKDKYGLSCYLTIIENAMILYAGLAYSLEQQTVLYELEKNTVSISDLKFEVTGDKKYKIRIINFSKNGSKTEFETGHKDGELRTLHFYGNNDIGTLRQRALSELNKMKVEGYSGGFETFLVPVCEPGSLASLKNTQYPGRTGKYFISAVTTTLNGSGGRRKNEIGIKIG